MTINSKGLFFTDLLAAQPADAFAVNFRRTVSRELLKRCGELELTPGKLAKKANIPLSTLNNVLNGISINPGILTLLSVCEGLELRLDDVVHTAFEAAAQAQEALAAAQTPSAEAQTTGGDL